MLRFIDSSVPFSPTFSFLLSCQPASMACRSRTATWFIVNCTLYSLRCPLFISLSLLQRSVLFELLRDNVKPTNKLAVLVDLGKGRPLRKVL